MRPSDDAQRGKAVPRLLNREEPTMRTPLHHATATRLRTALRALALCAVISPAICVAQNAVIDGFIPTSDLPSRQLDLSSATLRTGKVLMTDGQNVDIYDPATRAFSAGAP
jgi:hypothetical protein